MVTDKEISPREYLPLLREFLAAYLADCTPKERENRWLPAAHAWIYTQVPEDLQSWVLEYVTDSAAKKAALKRSRA